MPRRAEGRARGHLRFSGTVVWGDPSSDDAEQWTVCADLRLSDACEPHATLFDASRVDRLVCHGAREGASMGVPFGSRWAPFLSASPPQLLVACDLTHD